MSEDYNIRLINKLDLRSLLDLYKHFDNGDPELEDSMELEELWDSIYKNPNIYYIVVEHNGLLVSTCNITIIQNLTRNMKPYALIENVVTHKQYRNRGLGKKVLHKAINIAKDKGCYKVMLLTGSKKEETLNFYKSVGFRDDIKIGFIIKL